MEKLLGLVQEEDQMDMPPGFRFHPTDEELITHYLSKKVSDSKFFAKAIGEVDMNKIEPWDLPRLAKMGEKEWFFFCLRDRKYPTGLRTNRATAAGYWKATGKDNEIFRGRLLVGMKKTLVFYSGRAPKGEKTNWIIHEYRFEGKLSLRSVPKSAKQNEWVICRVFHKNSGGNKVNISGVMRIDSGGVTTSLPPLINSPTVFDGRIVHPTISESIHVPCLSNSIDIQTTRTHMINNFINNPIFPFDDHSDPILHPFPSSSSFPVNDQVILKGLINIYGHGKKLETEMVTWSQETGVSLEKNVEICSNFGKGQRGIIDQETAPSTSVGLIDLDCLWNY